MKSRIKSFLAVNSMAIILLSPFAVCADKYIPEHLCFKPEKPLFMASKYHKQIYEEDVKRYKFCIRDFIREQEQMIIIHKEAIKKATNDWNEFMEEGGS